ncbi:MAG: hypothetical protein WCG90_01260 [Chitinophagia bacterium]|jgi:hypothetical protein
MIKNEILEIGEQYFLYFEKKDINSLRKLFSKEIKLFDPIVKSVVGIEDVLLANIEIFKSSEKISIKNKKLFVDYFSDTLIAELEIQFDLNIINVVDIIVFDANKKIISITAYLDTEQTK